MSMDERPEKPRTEDQSRLPFSVDADTANRCQAGKKRINENQSLQLTHIFHSSSSPPARRRQPVPDSTAKHLLHQIANHCGCVKILTSPSSSALQSMMRTGWAKASESMAEAYSCNKTYVFRRYGRKSVVRSFKFTHLPAQRSCPLYIGNLQSDSHRTFATLTVYFKSRKFFDGPDGIISPFCVEWGGTPRPGNLVWANRWCARALQNSGVVPCRRQLQPVVAATSSCSLQPRKDL